MKSYRRLPFREQIKWRIRGQWAVFFLMLVYMIVIGETGGGDSRIMTPLAAGFSRVAFFGGMLYIIYRLIRNKKLLKDQKLLKEKFLAEKDERRRYLHDKSGGIVWDILFVLLLCAALTASLYDMAAFYAVYGILLMAVIIKIGFYIYYSKAG